RHPAATANATALRSAHTLSGEALYSAFPAAKIRPPAGTAAPTRNREYGAYALARARLAARSNAGTREREVTAGYRAAERPRMRGERRRAAGRGTCPPLPAPPPPPPGASADAARCPRRDW